MTIRHKFYNLLSRGQYALTHPFIEYMFDFSFEIVFGPTVVSASWDMQKALDPWTATKAAGARINPNSHDFRPLMYQVKFLGFDFELFLFRYPPAPRPEPAPEMFGE